MPDKQMDEAFIFSDLIEYQDQAIVSRQILKENGGNITLFAFDQGQELSEHSAPFDALLHIFEGEISVSLSKKPHVLFQGQSIIMPANVPHALKANKKSKALLIMIKK